MSGAIAVFVKTPGLSPVKTRLAVTLGKKTAEAFYMASARSVSSVIQQLSEQADVVSYYAVAEQSAINHHYYWDDLPCVWQGEGGLGERMAHIYQTLLTQHEFVILVGSDVPQMNINDLTSASEWLAYDVQAQLAFGSSADGGFWLFGGNCDVPHAIWTEVIYSKADTGTQFFKKIEPLGHIKTLSCLRDVDDSTDLIPLREALVNLTDPLAEQSELLDFLNTLAG